MKKALLIVLLIFVLFFAFANGKSDSYSERTTIRIGALKGPTSMGLVKLLEDNEQSKTINDYSFTMAASADELTPLFLRGDLDVIAVPANLAGVLYNKSNKEVKLAAINTLGVLYIVSTPNQKIETLSDLESKTIYATGKNTMPEAVLNYILNENSIENCDIQFRSEPTEIVTLLKSSESGIAMLPQPFVTVAQTQIPGLKISFDLTNEYRKVSGLDLITGVLLVRKEFVEKNEKAFKVFLEEYEKSTLFSQTNISEASLLIEKAGIVKAAVAEKALPYCNIVCITGNEMKEICKEFFAVLYNYNPAYVGGSLPDDELYF